MSRFEGDLDEWDRRALMQSLGPVGLGAIAGCLGDESGDEQDATPRPEVDVPEIDQDDDGRSAEDPTGDDDEEDETPIEELVDPRKYVIDGQTLRLPGSFNPQTAHTTHHAYAGHAFEAEDLAERDHQLLYSTNEWTVLNGWMISALWSNPGEPHGILYDNVEFSEERVRMEIREDAQWHDGVPVTAKDAMLNIHTYGLSPGELGGVYGRMHKEARVPDGLDGKVIEIEALPSLLEYRGFRMLQEGWVQYWMFSPWSRWGGVKHGTPAHKYPYDEAFERVWEIAQARFEVTNENPELWNEPEYIEQHIEEHELDMSPFDVYWWENMPEEFRTEEKQPDPIPGLVGILVDIVDEGEGPELLDRSTDPDWYVGHGLFQLAEKRGTQGYRLEPYEDHRLYDEHTFDEIFIEWSEEDHRTRAGLMAERFDWANQKLSPELLNNLPEKYLQLTHPEGGAGIGTNHAYWPGDSVWVRQALMYATDTSNVATNIHPSTAAQIKTPGWDNWGADTSLEKSWADENLTTYEYDAERATELMERAGYERIDGRWHDADGKPINDRIATAEDEPVMEETVAHQWREFGLGIQTQLFDDASYQERLEGSGDVARPGDGDFALYRSGKFAGWLQDYPGHMYSSINYLRDLRARNWFGPERTDGVIAENYAPDMDLDEYDKDERVYDYYNTDALPYLTWQIPPAGEPESDERVPFGMAYVREQAVSGVKDFTGDDQPIKEGVYEPDRLNVDHAYQAMAWAINWYLPTLPMVRTAGQNFLNTQNFLWGPATPDVEGIETEVGPVADMWKWFGLLSTPWWLPSTNLIWANPEEPKIDAAPRRK